ncbi:AraC family transcriptional regulator [Zestomonas thermotolerans]|uniref:AraC family transcriptional regulator n=1 Tax=Zestomonas thermotolerans TaxID=157784 RepID=UPI0003603812|nr:AraC family transcriptional regulator [Pseudomonas thermotolerans]
MHDAHDSPLTHSATLRRQLYEALAEQGLDPTEVYRRVYQHRRLTAVPVDARLEHDSAPLFWQALPEITGDPDIGLHLGEAMKPRLLDVVGYLMLASSDLQQALDSLVRFQAILSGGLLARLQVEDDEARLVIDLNYLGHPPLRQQMECLALLLIKLLGFLTDGEFRLSGLHFRHAQPRRTAEHRRLFGLLPCFGQAHDCLLFPAALLRRPSRTANPGLHALLSAHARRELDGLLESQLLNRLRYLLGVRLAGGDCSLAACAAELGMSAAGLQRALAAQGSSLRQVRESVRQQRARELLRRGVAIREVARACGFAELSPFYRAFRRWYGETPERFRARQRDPAGTG